MRFPTCSLGLALLLLLCCHRVVAQDFDSPGEGLELPLLEDLETEARTRPKKKTRKKTTKNRYPYERFEIETTYRYGYNDNVFDSASIPVPGDPKVLRHQSDRYQEGWFDFEYDYYFSRGTKFSLDYFYKGEFYRDFPTKDRDRHKINLQWQKRLDKGKYVRFGFRESRRLANAHSRFGEKFDTDFDYFRTDLYSEYEFDPTDRDEIRLEYRLVNYNYDEDPDGQSDDWTEHRLLWEWEREIAEETYLTFFTTTKWRSYREEFARRGIDGERVPGVGREQNFQEFGVEIEKEFRPGFEVDLEVAYQRLSDPYQDYYSYDGLLLDLEVEYPITEKLRFEGDARLFKRDYDKRRFLASRVPNPNPPPKRLDPFIELYEDYLIELALYYRYSEKMEWGAGWIHRWFRVNDPTEAFRRNEFFFQLRYYYKKIHRKPRKT